MSVASLSRRLCLTRNRIKARLMAPEARAAFGKDVVAIHTVKQILARDKKK